MPTHVQPPKTVCLVAIIKNEDRFLEEWISYHLLIGIKHFFLYDDGSTRPLAKTLANYSKYVTITTWANSHQHLEGRNRQTKAYQHAANSLAIDFEWIAFIDCDEFIVLTENRTIQDFLSGFKGVGCVSLNWYFFGHNGYYDYPDGLITASLTRRRLEAGIRTKSICRSIAIDYFNSAHFCVTKPGWSLVDANNLEWNEILYPGKTQRAHINHYYCRSFLGWRDRVNRGDVAFDSIENLSDNQLWRFNDIENLKQFVTSVAVFDNEYEDDYMLRFSAPIRKLISEFATGMPLSDEFC